MNATGHCEFYEMQPPQEAVVVKRTVGFNARFPYVAEMTAPTPDGGVATLREFGHTPEGAATRVKLAFQGKLTGRKRAAGFMAEGFRTENRKAKFRVGFKFAPRFA